MVFRLKYPMVIMFLLATCFLYINSSAQWSIPVYSYETECLISYADYSPDGRYIAGCCSDNSIVIWNTETGLVHRTLTGLKKQTNVVCFNKTGDILYSGAANGSVSRWDPDRLLLVKTIKGHQGAIKAIALSPDGKLLATGGNDKIIRIWNADSLTLIRELKSHSKLITSLTFSHDGEKLISGSADMTLCLWEARTGKGHNMTKAHDGWVRAVVFSPDDRIIASCGDDYKICLWNSRDISRITCLTGHTDWVQTLDFSRDGNYLISGGHDKQIILWNLSEKKEIVLQKDLENIILNTRFSPDGNSILSTQLLTNKIDIWENVVTTPESLAEKPDDLPLKENDTGEEASTREVDEAHSKTVIEEPARIELEAAIDETEFNEPICPVFQNVTASAVTDPEAIKKNLKLQLTAPVRWTQTAKNMIAEGAASFTEVGPGNVLQGLIKKVNREVETNSAG